jgi:hypothetical protein
LQIELLQSELQQTEQHLNEIHLELNEERQSRAEQEAQLLADVSMGRRRVKELEIKLHTAEQESERARQELLLNQLEQPNSESSPLSTLRKQQLAGGMRGVGGSKHQSTTNRGGGHDAVYRGVRRMQAIVRGVLRRAAMRKNNLARRAEVSGVMVAAMRTLQGETGWYHGPNNSMYYMVKHPDLAWMTVAGPISALDYEETCFPPALLSRIAKKRKTSIGGTGGRAGFLVRCGFELSVEHDDVVGELYVDRKSRNLFVAVPVDEMVTGSTIVI